MSKWLTRVGAVGFVAAMLAAEARATGWEVDALLNTHTEVPEPATMMLVGAGLLTAFRVRRPQ